jgi:hypothetical protein
MNFTMMVLTDCISITGPVDHKLINFISKFGHITELRAVAYKDL